MGLTYGIGASNESDPEMAIEHVMIFLGGMLFSFHDCSSFFLSCLNNCDDASDWIHRMENPIFDGKNHGFL